MVEEVADYDAQGNVISQVDAKGRSAQKRYDELQRLTVDIDADNYETKYTYDSRDNLLTVTDANNNTHSFTYDRLGRKKTEARPMGQTISYTYDPNGNLIERLSPNGAIRKYFFDDDDRLEREEHYPPGASTPSKTNTFTYDQRGMLLSYADGLTAGEYQYDDKGQKIQETITFGTGTPEAFSKTLHRSYEPNGLLKTLTFPDGGVQEYTYDTDNQLQTYKIPGLEAGNDTLTYTYRWNSIQTITMPGGLKRTVTLDPLQRPERIEVKPIAGNGASIMDHRYEYDPVSNINKKTTLDGDYVYGYDNLDRLTSAVPPQSLQVSPSNPDGLPVEGFAYDPVHNRIRSDHQAGPWIYNANNELNEWGAADERRVIDYDVNGSTTRQLRGEAPVSEDTEYVYDPQDRLAEVKRDGVTVVRYAYDPFGRRVLRKVEGGTNEAKWYLFSLEGLTAEYRGAYQERRFGWPPHGFWGTELVWYGIGELMTLASTDHLATVEVLTDIQSGSVKWRAMRESFGAKKTSQPVEVDFNMSFPGQLSGETYEAVYNFHRDYSQNTGRYLQQEPLYPLSVDVAYVYAAGNPIAEIDELGLWSWQRINPNFYRRALMEEKRHRNSGNAYNLSFVTLCCLTRVFGDEVWDVNVREHSTLPEWQDNLCRQWKGPKAAANECQDTWVTTRKMSIFVDGAGYEFEADGATVLHEFFHVIRQWNPDRMTRKQYLTDPTPWEREADGAESGEASFEKCRKENCSCPEILL